MKVYLDNAASTPLDAEVIREMTRAMEEYYGNPSSIHAHGRQARSVIEKARRSIASLIKAAPSEVFFTSGGSESDNTAIIGTVRDLGIRRVISSPLEHDAVIHTLQALQARGEIELILLDVDAKGNVDLIQLETLLNGAERSFVSLMHANNELGTLTDIRRVAELCHLHQAIFHSDTVQTMGHLPFNMRDQGLHFATGSAHKFHGPKGTGFIYINSDVKIGPFVSGGSQERNMRGGTENIYGIVGLAKAFELAHAEMEATAAHIGSIKQHTMESLLAAIPGVSFNGELGENSLYTVLNVSLPEMEMADMLLFNLDIAGISASSGSACSSGTNIGSHVLDAIHANPQRPAMRFSFSKLTTIEEIDYMVKTLREICVK